MPRAILSALHSNLPGVKCPVEHLISDYSMKQCNSTDSSQAKRHQTKVLLAHFKICQDCASVRACSTWSGDGSKNAFSHGAKGSRKSPSLRVGDGVLFLPFVVLNWKPPWYNPDTTDIVAADLF